MGIYHVCIWGGLFRPYAKEGIGITSFECSYYTFRASSKSSRSAVTWRDLAAISEGRVRENGFRRSVGHYPYEIPYWRPKSNLMPVHTGHKATACWIIRKSARRLKPRITGPLARIRLRAVHESAFGDPLTEATRFNASKIDRIIGLAMNSWIR